jgi:hypothetical protein
MNGRIAFIVGVLIGILGFGPAPWSGFAAFAQPPVWPPLDGTEPYDDPAMVLDATSGWLSDVESLQLAWRHAVGGDIAEQIVTGKLVPVRAGDTIDLHNVQTGQVDLSATFIEIHSFDVSGPLAEFDTERRLPSSIAQGSITMTTGIVFGTEGPIEIVAMQVPIVADGGIERKIFSPIKWRRIPLRTSPAGFVFAGAILLAPGICPTTATTLDLHACPGKPTPEECRRCVENWLQTCRAEANCVRDMCVAVYIAEVMAALILCAPAALGGGIGYAICVGLALALPTIALAICLQNAVDKDVDCIYRARLIACPPPQEVPI